jgi:hypothetical protein
MILTQDITATISEAKKTNDSDGVVAVILKMLELSI